MDNDKPPDASPEGPPITVVRSLSLQARRPDPAGDPPVLAHALRLAAVGVAVFPAKPEDKTPYLPRDRDADDKPIPGTGGLKKASSDEAQIRAWWKKWPAAMIGVPMGESSGLVAIDPDRPKGEGAPDGVATWQSWIDQHGDPGARVHRTPHGGLHHFFAYDRERPVNNGDKHVRTLGINIRGQGGYVVWPPSIMIDGKSYAVVRDIPIDEVPPLPSWLYDKIRPSRPPAAERRPEPARTDPDARQRPPKPNGHASGEAVHPRYVAAALEDEACKVAGAVHPSRHAALNEAAFALGQLVGPVLSSDEVTRALRDACTANGMIGEGRQDEVERTIADGLRAGMACPRTLEVKPIQNGEARTRSTASDDDLEGGRTREGEVGPNDGGGGSGGGDPPPPEPPEPGDAEIEALNAEYCVVRDAGRVRVLTFEEVVLDPDDDYRRSMATYLSFDDFTNLYRHRAVFIPAKDGSVRPVRLGALWLNHSRRRTYFGVVFRPGEPHEIGRSLNLWRGWGVEPKQGEWPLMQAHIAEVLAGGDTIAETYILRWLAWTLQNPNRPAEVALVFRGKRGTGKGTLGNAMRRIFGQHGLQISSALQLAGRFNAHLRDCCFLFADEAYWPGDKASEGNLKRLITEPTLAIEGKGQNVVEAPNMLHVMMGSNEDWVVPAGEHERRFVILDVSESHMQDRDWFDPLWKELNSGGLEAMFYDLLHMDLEGWHPRQLIRTDALVQQQARTLEPEDEWWAEILDSGVIPSADPANPHKAVAGAFTLVRDTGDRNSFGDKITTTLHKRGLYADARDASPRLKNRSNEFLAAFLKKRGCENKERVLRHRGWTFPLLSQCRADWEKRYPGWTWTNPSLTEWTREEDTDDPEPPAP